MLSEVHGDGKVERYADEGAKQCTESHADGAETASEINTAPKFTTASETAVAMAAFCVPVAAIMVA